MDIDKLTSLVGVAAIKRRMCQYTATFIYSVYADEDALTEQQLKDSFKERYKGTYYDSKKGRHVVYLIDTVNERRIGEAA